ncbi:hypothetical protein ABTO25_21345, partial [Acinetobacter baumannii]
LIDLKLIAPSNENYSELPEQISPQESSITTKEIHQKNVDENKSNDLVGEIQVPQSTSAPSSNIENNQPRIPVQQLSF